MDSTINGNKIHIKNPLDLIGLGRHQLEFNIGKKAYWDMLKETMQVPKLKRGGVKNLLKGGWVYVDPYDQGSNLWTKDYFTKAGANEPCWAGFGNNGDIFDYGTYTGGYYGFKCPSSKNEEDYSKYNQINFLKPNTTYTWQWDMRRTSPYIKGDIETFMGTSSNTIIDRTKPFYINGVLYDGKAVDGYASWNSRISDQDTTWHRCVYTFTTKSSLPANGAKSLRWRAKKDSAWKVKNIMLFEGESISGEEFRLHEQEEYEYMLYEGRKGLREVNANFGFFYSEDFKFCSAFKVNIHNGFETVGFNPVTQEFEVRAEVESFAQIVDPVVKYYSNTKEIPSDKTWDNSLIYNAEANGSDYIQAKAKGCYMGLFKVAKENWSPDVPRRWLATFYKDNPKQWFYGGYMFTGNLQTYDIEN